jgi:hypothetical protein
VFYTFGEKWRARERYGGQAEVDGLSTEQSSTLDVALEAEGRAHG